MTYETLLCEEQDGILSLTLNQPQRRNTLSAEMLRELASALDGAAADAALRVVLLTGAGEEAFAVEAVPPTEEPLARPLSQQPGEWEKARAALFAALTALPQPVIAAISGEARGLGLELALACDLRLASEGARLILPATALGTLPRGGATQRLPRLVGRSRALEILLTGEPIDAATAFRLGLVSQVVSQQELAAAALALARAIADKAPLAVRQLKRALHRGQDLSLEEGLRLEVDLYMLLQTTEDRAEGLRAFLEKRAPVFRGR